MVNTVGVGLGSSDQGSNNMEMGLSLADFGLTLSEGGIPAYHLEVPRLVELVAESEGVGLEFVLGGSVHLVEALRGYNHFVGFGAPELDHGGAELFIRGDVLSDGELYLVFDQLEGLVERKLHEKKGTVIISSLTPVD